MKKATFLSGQLILFLLVTGCDVPQRSTETKESTSPMPGSDSDEHGCKGSAGYQWSVIKNKCIRLFEDGIRLDPLEATEDKTTAAYIVFSEDVNKAELFIPIVNGSLILERKAEGEAWVNGEWMLIAWKGYVLKKNDVAVYGGK